MAGAFGADRVAARPESRTCVSEIGDKAAHALVAECREVAVATRSTCRLLAPCREIREAIRHGCEALDAAAPPFCAQHVDPEEDEDDDG